MKDNLIYIICRGDNDDKEIFKITKDYNTAMREVYHLINYPEKYFGWTTGFNSIEVWDISKDINEKAEYIIIIDDIIGKTIEEINNNIQKYIKNNI